ncbi:MAG: ABC-ATPase domain-containing protein [bacterium]|nr:ABC-ATPase domain-containing protein [bacterium]
MLPSDRLRDKLIVMNGKGTQVYRTLAGAYRFDRFELHLDAIHPDPSSPSAWARVRVDQAEAQVPPALWGSPSGRLAAEEFLSRAVHEAIGRHVHSRWQGKAAPVAIHAGGGEILRRSCCTVGEEFVEIRLTIGFPAEGRKVLAKPAVTLLFDELPAVVQSGLVWANLDAAAGWRHRDTLEDYLALREALDELGLAAFVADGSVLPREDGQGERPLRGGRAVVLRAPDELAVMVALPHRGEVRGLGIRRGVTVIAGGAFSGKSTLLAALSAGVYPHVPGDGRELVATAPDAVRILTEPLRRVERVDISAFLRELPHRPDATTLSSEHATGTVSMAVGVAEAVEVGSRLLLFDEDESTVAFLVRDAAMQQLVPSERDPATPLLDRLRALWELHGVSSVIATGSLGEYLGVADTVIVMEGFQPQAATDRARGIVAGFTGRRTRAGGEFDMPMPRCPLPRGFGGLRGRGHRTELRGRAEIGIGRETISTAALGQLVGAGQACAAGDAILYALAKGYVDGNASIAEILDRVFADIAAHGLGVLATEGSHAGGYALPRRHEVAAVLNRMRALQVRTRRATPAAADPPTPPVSGADQVETPAGDPPPPANETV